MRHTFSTFTFPQRWYASVGGDVCPVEMGNRESLNLIARQEKLPR